MGDDVVHQVHRRLRHAPGSAWAAAQTLREGLAADLKTTFARRSYARTVSLAGALRAETIGFYTARNTGAKVLIDPWL